MSSAKPNPLTIPPELDAEMTPAVRAFVGSLLERIARTEAELQGLRGQVKGKTPQNSSLPPSTQHPHAKPPSRRRKSKKKRGGQPGHPKHERPLIPTEDCDDVQPLKPTECRRCGEKLLGQPCCPALTVKMQTQVTAALRPSYNELAAELPAQDHVSADETATKQENGKAWLWTFLRHERIEPTNNASERSLRHAVIWRKLSFGTQSAGGSRFVETMLTVIETCRQQRRNALTFVTATVEAHLARQPAPSLLSGV